MDNSKLLKPNTKINNSPHKPKNRSIGVNTDDNNLYGKCIQCSQELSNQKIYFIPYFPYQMSVCPLMQNSCPFHNMENHNLCCKCESQTKNNIFPPNLPFSQLSNNVHCCSSMLNCNSKSQCNVHNSNNPYLNKCQTRVPQYGTQNPNISHHEVQNSSSVSNASTVINNGHQTPNKMQELIQLLMKNNECGDGRDQDQRCSNQQEHNLTDYELNRYASALLDQYKHTKRTNVDNNRVLKETKSRTEIIERNSKKLPEEKEMLKNLLTPAYPSDDDVYENEDSCNEEDEHDDQEYCEPNSPTDRREELIKRFQRSQMAYVSSKAHSSTSANAASKDNFRDIVKALIDEQTQNEFGASPQLEKLLTHLGNDLKGNNKDESFPGTPKQNMFFNNETKKSGK